MLIKETTKKKTNTIYSKFGQGFCVSVTDMYTSYTHAPTYKVSVIAVASLKQRKAYTSKETTI